MKNNRAMLLILLILILLNFPIKASTSEIPKVLFMGKILEVQSEEENGSYRILVKGFLKGCEIYEEEIIVFITKDTKILPNKCSYTEEKLSFEKLNIEKGDNVYLVLNEAMTKSIPPQVSAKEAQITKITLF